MTKKEIQNEIEAIHQCEEDGKFELSFVGDKLFVICSICNEKVVSLLLEYATPTTIYDGGTIKSTWGNPLSKEEIERLRKHYE